MNPERMMRFQVHKFDSDTYQVVDTKGKGHEVCVCGNFEGHRDAKKRAKMIAKLLNENEA